MEHSLRRNIGIMAHIDAGKTTTSECILFYSGRSHKMGNVDQGSTQLDWMKQEQDRGITIQSATTSFNWKNCLINLIDTPGHVDFTAEVERSLRVLDGVIVVLCAVGGVQAQTETVWDQANKYKLSRIIFINKMDRVGANYKHVLEDVKKNLQGVPVPIQIPLGCETSFEGVIDLIHMQEIRFDESSEGLTIIRTEIDPKFLNIARQEREQLLDKISIYDDELTELLINDQEISVDIIQRTLKNATLKGQIQVVLYGSSLKHKGIQLLLDAVIDYLPSPEELPDIQALLHSRGEDKPYIVKRCADESLSALIFKIQKNKDNGILYYVRVYSGVLKVGISLYNVTKDKKEKPLRILLMHANEAKPVNELSAGNIGALIGLKFSQTGDSLCFEKRPILLDPIQFSTPVISISIEPKTPGDMDKLKEIFEILKREDPTFDIKEDSETGQIIISGMGELHLDVLCTRASEEFGLQFNLGKPQVSYRETITQIIEYQEEFSHIIAGKESLANLTLQVAPLSRGQGFEFHNLLSEKENLPNHIVFLISDTIKNSLQSGITIGYPIIDISVSLIKAYYDELKSSDAGWRICAATVFDKACRQAAPILLEPMMNVIINLPSEYTGEVTNQFVKLGGIISGIENLGNKQVIKGISPLKKIFGYSTLLRSQTRGRGTFTIVFSHFA